MTASRLSVRLTPRVTARMQRLLALSLAFMALASLTALLL